MTAQEIKVYLESVVEEYVGEIAHAFEDEYKTSSEKDVLDDFILYLQHM